MDEEITWTLDIIERISQANIGNTDRLNGIRAALEKGQQILPDDKKYLMKEFEDLQKYEKKQAKTHCWKCKQKIGFGKKSFDWKEFKENQINTPKNFLKEHRICADCFPEVVIFCDAYSEKGFKYINKIIEKQEKRDENNHKLKSRKDELKELEKEFLIKDGKKCFKCGKKTPSVWDRKYMLEWIRENATLLGLEGFGQKSMLCNDCGCELLKRKKEIEDRKNEIYSKEFVKKYGDIIKSTPSGLYYGGHKAYLAGGMFNDFQGGNLTLTQNYLMFVCRKFRIEIPLKSIIIEDWKVDEKTRRKTVSGGGLAFGLFGGYGTIKESGKGHDIVVPYIDENGIAQAPRFGVASLSGNAIREWAQAIYQQLVNVSKENKAQKTDSSEERHSESDEPLKLLKMRLAKGEITKEEFEDLRKIIDS